MSRIAIKAALLPAMTVRETSGEYVLYVEPALKMPRHAIPRRDGEALPALQFAQPLEDYVQQYQEQWPKWDDVRVWPG